MSNVPTRLLVLQRLQLLIESEPLVINGVPTDMSGKVFRGRNMLGEDATEISAMPCISIIESPRPDIATFAGEGEAREDGLTLLLTGLADDNMAERGDAGYYLFAALEERLARMVQMHKRSGNPVYPESFMLGNLITGVQLAPPVIRPEGDKLSSRASFFLPIRVGIGALLEQPYTSVP